MDEDPLKTKSLINKMIFNFVVASSIGWKFQENWLWGVFFLSLLLV